VGSCRYRGGALGEIAGELAGLRERGFHAEAEAYRDKFFARMWDPADYRWSGYGEAVAGVRRAREGLRLVVFGYGSAGGGFDASAGPSAAKASWKASSPSARRRAASGGSGKTGRGRSGAAGPDWGACGI